MGRHTAETAGSSPAATEPDRPPVVHPVGPITDPVLLVEIEQELRRFRHPDTSDLWPLPSAPTRRVETPFSGPVDVPVENAIGPEPLAPEEPPVTWMPAMRAPTGFRPATVRAAVIPATVPPADRSAVAPSALAPAGPAPVRARPTPGDVRPAPAPAPPHPASAGAPPRPIGPVGAAAPAAPARPAPGSAHPEEGTPPLPVPVSARGTAANPLLPTVPGAAGRAEDDPIEQHRPLGVSARTLLLGTGIGVLAATGLSLLALLPR